MMSVRPIHVFAVACLSGACGDVLAQRNLRDIPVPDPEAELKDFVVAEGFEVNLFAADPMLKKPIGMEFDADGRLWVATSAIYPQIRPGEAMTDEVVVLEDTDGDGRADESTVFADGFLIPTGVLPGDGGAYVGNSTDLVHMTDTDGDGRADEERIVLSGFGTEDTHHIIHAMTWGPSGEMFFNQSIYIHSHIETPHGVRRLDAGGIWRFQPDSLELDVFTRGQVNPWGHVFDEWGQSFTTDGAYHEGINYAFPGAQYVTAVGATRLLKGLNNGEPKHCGLVRVSGRHFPESWQGNLLANDFRANRVNRFVLSEAGSGYAATKQEDLLRSKRVTFRPVAIKMGPDGAVYIADWYNPIIQHGEVDFRDERRDKAHGRIWRVSAKGRPTLKAPRISGAAVNDLLALLTSSEQWTRSWARVELTRRKPANVVPALRSWLAGLERGDERFERHLLQGLWVLQGLDVYDGELLGQVLAAQDGRAKAAAMRAVAFGYVPDGDAAGYHAAVAGVRDEHPRVRLEAVRALGMRGGANAAGEALVVLERPMDRFLDYALWLTVRELEKQWLPEMTPEKAAAHPQPGKLLYALQALSDPTTSPLFAGLLKNPRLVTGELEAIVRQIGALGSPAELDAVLQVAMNQDAEASLRVASLEALVKAKGERNTVPDGEVRRVAALVGDPNASIRQAAIRLAGAWGVGEVSKVLVDMARSTTADWDVRSAAIDGLAGIADGGGRPALRSIAEADGNAQARLYALGVLARVATEDAADVAVRLLEAPEMSERGDAVASTLLARTNGHSLLAAALKGKTVPGEAAELALRALSSSGQSAPGLESALREAGGIEAIGMALDEAAVRELVQAVQDSGDAVRGENVYRRAGLLCIQCHAIGGAGGRVGPDLVSIGASAPIDYLIESLVEPSKKVKEGYHLMTVTTKDGGVFAGTGARKTDTHLILIDAADQEQAIPLGNVQSESLGQVSLMPAALTAGLSRGEFVDLVRFLHELGRTPDYSIGEGAVVRRWFAKNAVGEAGVPVYTKVDGGLPAAPVREALGGRQRGILTFDLEVSQPGDVVLDINDRGGVDRITSGGAVLAMEDPPVVTLDQAGRHMIGLRVSFAGRERRPLKVTVRPAPDRGAAFRVLNGD